MLIDHRVRWVREPTRTASLPAVSLPEHERGFAARFGEQLRDRGALIGLGGLATGVVAGVRTLHAGAGMLRTAATGAGASLLGASLLAGAGAGISMLLDATSRAPAVAHPAPVLAGDTAGTNEPLRVMTFNIHGGAAPGESFGGREQLERIARVIEREQPDVVLLQELNDGSIENAFADQLQQLADRLDADGAVFVPARRNASGREFGNGVLTFNGAQIADARGLLSPDVHGEGALRRAVGYVNEGTRKLTKRVTGTAQSLTDLPMYRPRTTADVLITTAQGTPVRVLSGHYSWPADGVDHPRRQIDPLTGILAAWDGPTILGADFNVKTGTARGDLEASAFTSAGMVDAFTAAGMALDDPARGTSGAGPGGNAIDRVYGSEALNVTAARVASFPSGEPGASDHRPVVVDYELSD